MVILEWVPLINVVVDIGKEAGWWFVDQPQSGLYIVAIKVFTTVIAAQICVPYVERMVLRLQELALLTDTPKDDEFWSTASRWTAKFASWLGLVSQIMLSLAAVDPKLKDRLVTVKKEAETKSVG